MSNLFQFYCGIGEQQWNLYPVASGPLACISPVYGQSTARKCVNRVTVPDGTQVIQDSGAFSDGPGQRLNFAEALRRQDTHALRFSYTDQVIARASYDLLIDEMWEEDEHQSGLTRTKRRWSETQAELAVQETIAAARYLSQHRNGLPCLLSAQGVSARQYRYCAERILRFLHDEDTFGLGGWCITGKLPAQMMPVFRETMHQVIPLLGREGVRRVHIWGVCYAPALGELLWLCDQWNITLSTDSVGPSVRPARGRWGYADWTDLDYHSVVSCRPEETHETSRVKTWNGDWIEIPCARGAHRAELVHQVREWLAHLRETRYFPVDNPRYLQEPHQLSFFAKEFAS